MLKIEMNSYISLLHRINENNENPDARHCYFYFYFFVSVTRHAFLPLVEP